MTAAKDFPLDLDERRLLDEWGSYPDLTSWHRHQLTEAGVSLSVEITAGELTTPRIRPAGRLFIPDPLGVPAYCLKVYDGPTAGPFNPDSTIPLLDLLAFRLEEPARWWLRRGRYDLVLGKDQVVDAMATSGACILHPTPLQWLQMGCKGACLLDLAAACQVAA